MDIFTSYFGLSVAFLLISSLFSFILIYAKIPLITKIIFIPLVLWFTVALYFIPPKLMGWPTTTSPPTESIVLYSFIKEPRSPKKGFIDLVLLVKNNEVLSLVEQLNPVKVFGYTNENTERLYRIPYSRSLHRKLIEARKKAGETSTPMILRNLGKGKTDNDDYTNNSSDRLEFEVVDPNDFYPEK